MIDFIIKSTISLGVLYLFYLLFLRDLKTFNFNRYFLLGSLIFSFTIPLLSIPIDFDASSITRSNEIVKNISSTIVQLDEEVIVPQNKIAFTHTILPYIYAIVALTLFSRFFYNLFNIISIVRRNIRIRKSDYWIVLDKDCKLPYTFFNYIIVGADDYEKGIIDQRIMQHEITHANQFHSVDIVLVELFKVFVWMNPFVWFLKKQMQLNHEYLADSSVITNNSIIEYKRILINLVLDNNIGTLTSNFNFSITKQRLYMMTKQFSKKKAITNILASGIFVLFLGIVLAFSQKSIGFKININGSSGNYVKKGLKLSQSDMMEIETNYKNVTVEEFDVTLARGNRALLSSKKVKGNLFHVNEYVGNVNVREGDRIVVQVLKLSDSNIELPFEKSVVSIPIKSDK